MNNSMSTQKKTDIFTVVVSMAVVFLFTIYSVAKVYAQGQVDEQSIVTQGGAGTILDKMRTLVKEAEQKLLPTLEKLKNRQREIDTVKQDFEGAIKTS